MYYVAQLKLDPDGEPSGQAEVIRQTIEWRGSVRYRTLETLAAFDTLDEAMAVVRRLNEETA